MSNESVVFNPTEGEQMARHIGRVGRLRQAVAKATGERKDSLLAELERREHALRKIKQEIDGALGDL